MDQQDIKFYNKIFPKTRLLWLNKVSRTFTLSIRILPATLRTYIGHSYLLCRLLDTIEDAAELTVEKKKEGLDIAIKSIESPSNLSNSDQYLLRLSLNSRFTEEEKILLTNSHFIFACLETFPPPVRQIIQQWSIEMAVGMKKYCFGRGKRDKQLNSMQELDEYIYYVAGTVGKLLTGILALKKYKISAKRIKILDNNCIDFGKALQLVNIIKDSRSDKLEGRCYIPAQLLKEHNLDLPSFFDAANKQNIEKVYRQLQKEVYKYLANAVTYINALPLRHFRYKLACTWIVALAYKTLSGLNRDLKGFIEGSHTYKITRKEVKKTIRKTIITAFSNTRLNRYFAKISK